MRTLDRSALPKRRSVLTRAVLAKKKPSLSPDSIGVNSSDGFQTETFYTSKYGVFSPSPLRGEVGRG